MEWFSNNITLSTASPVFKVLPLTQLIQTGIAQYVFSRNNLSGWKIVTPLSGANLDNGSTTNLYWSTGDVCLPLNASDTQNGSTIQSSNSANINPSTIQVLFVLANSSYATPITSTQWRFTYDNTGDSGSGAFSFWFVPSHSIQTSTGQTNYVLGNAMASVQGASTFPDTTRTIAAVNPLYIANLTPPMYPPGTTETQLEMQQTPSPAPTFLPPYEFASNIQQHQGGVTSILLSQQVNSNVNMGTQYACWSISRATPYCNFTTVANNSTYLSPTDESFILFFDVLVPSQVAQCCSNGGQVALLNCGQFVGVSSGTSLAHGPWSIH